MTTKTQEHVLTSDDFQVAGYDFWLVIDTEDGTYHVAFPDFPSVITYADNKEDAIAHAHQALTLHLNVMRRQGTPLPKPTTAYKGDLHLRIGKSLHKSLDRYAEREGLSLNAAAAQLLAMGLGNPDR